MNPRGWESQYDLPMPETHPVRVPRPDPAAQPAQLASSTALQRVIAWSVHAFTLSGAAWACLATLALVEGRIVHMWLWLGIALIVDGVDGTLARKAEVLRHAPMFDGRTLDNIVDYLTWSFIPAVFMYKYIDFGFPALGLVMFVVICVSSLLCYCNLALKSDDHFFMGFPAAWNIVAVYMWILGTGPVVNVTATILLAALTVSPLAFVHPFRVVKAMPINIAAGLTWLVSTAVLVAKQPLDPPLALALWWVSALWLAGLSATRTARELNRLRGLRSPVL